MPLNLKKLPLPRLKLRSFETESSVLMPRPLYSISYRYEGKSVNKPKIRVKERYKSSRKNHVLVLTSFYLREHAHNTWARWIKATSEWSLVTWCSSKCTLLLMKILSSWKKHWKYFCESPADSNPISKFCIFIILSSKYLTEYNKYLTCLLLPLELVSPCPIIGSPIASITCIERP